MTDFTPNQKRAYEQFGNNCLVSAGAGSGKTAVLSERVRYLVGKKGLKINEFLILTFTNSAAKEMKDRIRNKLKEIKSEEAEKIDNANITTFDAYALSLVRKYHYLLGVEKNIAIIDENILDELARKINEAEFQKLIDSKDPSLVAFFNAYASKDISKIKDLPLRIYGKYRKALKPETFKSNFLSANDKKHADEALEKIFKHVDETVESLRILIDEINDQKYTDKLEELIDNYFTSEDDSARLNNIRELFASFPRKNPKADDAESEDEARDIKDALKEYLKDFTSIDDHYRAYEITDNFSHALWEIVEKIVTQINAYKVSLNAYTFFDVAIMGMQLFKQHPEVKDSIKNSLKTIMIDEYQDTSPLQEEFINYIANNNVYMVGDIKQSIYRFRDATPKIFIDKFNAYAKGKGGELIVLQDNFRSRKEVLEDINNIFSLIMKEDLGGANYLRDHLINAGNPEYEQVKDLNSDYHSELYCYDPLGNSEANAEQEAKIIVEDIINKVNNGYLVKEGKELVPCKLSSFCLILDKGTRFDLISKVFKEYQIPLEIERNENVANSKLLIFIISALNLIEEVLNHNNETRLNYYYLSLMRSFIFNKDDDYLYHTIKNKKVLDDPDLKRIVELYKTKADLSMSDFFFTMLQEFRVYQNLSRIGEVSLYERYLDSIFSILDTLASFNYKLSDYIAYFDNLKEHELKFEIPSSSSDFDAVKIMNIHKSKGLEFPVVYMCGLTSNFNRREFSDTFIINEEHGLFANYLNGAKSPLFIDYKNEAIREDLSEKIRLFYVAYTRAKEKVILVLPHDKEETKIKELSETTSLSNFIKNALGYFKVSDITLCETKPSLKLVESALNEEKITYEDVKFADEEIKVTRASKQLTFEANKEILKRGTRLHFYLETIDFLKPDYSFIKDENDKTLIKNFVDTPLIQNLKKPLFFKEYDFIDDINHHQGSIDLLIIDEDKAYIVDYKLKNIDDEHYANQLKVYFDYVSAYFKLTPKCYLYSILTSTFKEISIK